MAEKRSEAGASLTCTKDLWQGISKTVSTLNLTIEQYYMI